MGKTQKPVIAPFPELNERVLRFQREWRTVALLADQAAHAKYLYPKSLTAEKFEREFKNAAMGLYRLHQEIWESGTLRDNLLALEETEAAERAWLERNGVVGE